MEEKNNYTRERRDTRKEQSKLMSITEVAALLKVETHVLRYWEDEFGLEIKRSETGRRMYSLDDIDRFKKIIECKKAGMKIKEMKEKKELLLKKDLGSSDFSQNEKCQNDKMQMNKFILKPNVYQMDRKTNMNEQLICAETSNMPDFEQKMQRLQDLMVQVLTKSVQANLEEIRSSMTEDLKETLQKELDFQFREFEERQIEIEEKHYRDLDALLRNRMTKKRRKLMQ